jgi:hypothetical protein
MESFLRLVTLDLSLDFIYGDYCGLIPSQGVGTLHTCLIEQEVFSVYSVFKTSF